MDCIIQTLTPSQWKPKLYPPPITERYGPSHIGMTSSSLPIHARDASHKKRLELLVFKGEAQSTASTLPPLDFNKDKLYNDEVIKRSGLRSVADLLGAEPSAVGVSFRKTGGIFGNFFHDASSRTRQLMSEKAMENKRKIQMEGNLKIEKSLTVRRGKPRTTLTRIRNFAEMSPYDTGTQSEAEMMEAVSMNNIRLTEVIRRLQRIYRLYALKRIRKLCWWRQYAALSIQRCLRGYFGRLYSTLLRKLQPVAVNIIQSCFRHYQTMKVVYRWRDLVRRIIRALPKIKRFVNNCFKSWIRRRNAFAILIQSMVRAHLAKLKYLRQIGKVIFLHGLFPSAALLIQKTFRGFRGRCIYKSLIRIALESRIRLPRCIKIQAMFRGYRGRLVALRKRYEWKCLVVMQRSFRYWLFLQRLKKRVILRRMIRSAILIQRVFRGTYDRKIAAALRKDQHFHSAFVPSVLRIQAIARGRAVRKMYHQLQDHGEYAKIIQRSYRKHLWRRQAAERHRATRQKKLVRCTVVLQKTIRAFLAKRKFREIMLASAGNRLHAAKLIMRTWLGYKFRFKYEALRVKHRLRLFASKLIAIQNSRAELEDDIREIRDDINYIQKAMNSIQNRIKHLNAFVIQTENRLPRIVKQMEELTDYDLEYSWDEALTLEHASLTRRSAHAVEELRMLRNSLMLKRKERIKLYLELGMPLDCRNTLIRFLEEAEIELDEIAVREVETFEMIRRNEVDAINRRVNRERKFKVRREKCFWKVENIRQNVIQRHQRRKKRSLVDKVIRI